MKNRKSPIPLITGIVVLLAAAGAYNLYNSREASKTPEQIAAEMQMEAMKEAQKNQPTTGPSASEVAASVKARASNPAHAPESAHPGEPDTPTILVPVQKKYHPVPNDSATTSRWYDKEHSGSKK